MAYNNDDDDRSRFTLVLINNVYELSINFVTRDDASREHRSPRKQPLWASWCNLLIRLSKVNFQN